MVQRGRICDSASKHSQPGTELEAAASALEVYWPAVRQQRDAKLEALQQRKRKKYLRKEVPSPWEQLTPERQQLQMRWWLWLRQLLQQREKQGRSLTVSQKEWLGMAGRMLVECGFITASTPDSEIDRLVLEFAAATDTGCFAGRRLKRETVPDSLGIFKGFGDWKRVDPKDFAAFLKEVPSKGGVYEVSIAYLGVVN